MFTTTSVNVAKPLRIEIQLNLYASNPSSKTQVFPVDALQLELLVKDHVL